MIVEFFFGIAAESIIGMILGDAVGAAKKRLQGDPARKTMIQALATAVDKYAAVEKRLVLARPFLQENSLLTEKVVLEEFAKVLTFDQVSDYQLIGEQWQAALKHQYTGIDFSNEAKILLRYFEQELRNTEMFKPVFQEKSLDAIADRTDELEDSILYIESQLASLASMVDARYTDLAQIFLQTSPTIKDYIRDFTWYIEEKTRDFVGRQFVFDAIHQFIDQNSRGYFFLRGDPGIGKSAIAAQLVKAGGYLHHFNIRTDGINKPSDFLKNICAQLIATYSLNHLSLPPEATQDSGFLNELLNDVSDRLSTNEKCVIIIDALDEVDLTGNSRGVNVLYLPRSLPEGIFIIVTSRREELPLRIDIPEQESLYIEQDDAGNIADIRVYMVEQTPKQGIQAYIKRQEIDDELFIEHMVEKSQGNFIYLRMVLPEIEKGAYTDLRLAQIPAGLHKYYEDHWTRIKRQSELDWFDYKLHVVLALTVVKEPVSIQLISEFSYIEDKHRIRAVLMDFEQFLYITDVEFADDITRCYRWYHSSFFEFIAGLQEIKDERVDLIEANKKIADSLWNDLFNE